MASSGLWPAKSDHPAMTRTVATTMPWLMFWLLGVIWGSSFIFMKMASLSLTPLQIVLFRVLCGVVPVALYAWWHDLFRVWHARHVGHFLVMAVVGTIAYYYGFAKGTSLLLSGVAGALSGLTPILSFILAMLFLADERLTAYRACGITLGFVGVVLIANPFAADLSQSNLEGIAYNLVGSLGVGASFVYAKRYVVPLEIPFTAVITYQLALSAIILVFVTDLAGSEAIWSDVGAATGLVVGLGMLGTGLAFILYYNIIEALGAVSAASVAYVPPVVALLIGFVLVGEAISAMEFAGAVLILVGVVLVNRQPEPAD